MIAAEEVAGIVVGIVADMPVVEVVEVGVVDKTVVGQLVVARRAVGNPM